MVFSFFQDDQDRRVLGADSKDRWTSTAHSSARVLGNLVRIRKADQNGWSLTVEET
jgi:hypothetical protein